MGKIKDIVCFEVLDSRGIPTIRCLMKSASGYVVHATSPSGASCGTHEAVELRDNDSSRYFGKGVRGVIDKSRRLLIPHLLGFRLDEQALFDQKLIDLDATPNKSKFGANSLLAISLAYAKLSCSENNQHLFQSLSNNDVIQLPVPLVNVINGGVHSNNALQIQEIMLVPFGFDSFSDSIRCASELFTLLKRRSSDLGYATSVGDEGGLAPSIQTVDEALDLLSSVIDDSNYKLSEHVSFALDCASNEFYRDGKYSYAGESFDSKEWLGVLEGWVNKYPIVSIEDGFHEDDWLGWQLMVDKLGKKIQCVGDDLFVTSNTRIQKGLELNAANAVLIKPNQVGTLTETLQSIQTVKNRGWQPIISHRSGDTEDCVIADICVGMQVSQIKTGSTCRSERTAKYNRLLEIQEFHNKPKFGMKGWSSVLHLAC